MKVNKPKFWDKQIGIFSILLLPFSLITIIIIYIKKKLTDTQKFNIPIICVGNIYLGGTGKTPLSIMLANELSDAGKKPVILRKYYKSHKDEYNLIKKNFRNLIVNKKRAYGLVEAEKLHYDVAILDDGFQDYTIRKDLSIICFNGNQLTGNGLILPSGPLRENLSSLKQADIVIINGIKNSYFEKKILKINKDLNIFYSNYKPTNIDTFKNKKLCAIAGIGNPENFFKLILENDLNVEKKIIFPDHYEIKKDEIQSILDQAEKNDQQIIMTEKDFFKVKNYNLKKIDYLKIALEIDEKNKLLNILKNL